VLSVVIPTQNCERALVRTLAMLVAGVTAGSVREVILADGGSTDATAEIGDVTGCHIMISPRPLGARLKDAADKARGPWLMFLRPGAVLDPTWAEETARFIEYAEMTGTADSRAGVFRPLASPAGMQPGLMATLALVYRSLATRPRPEHGLVIARRHYDRVGGHRERVSDPELDLLRRLGRKNIAVLQCGVRYVED
jgi:glycosyltransferase involved in cell wall biosynthesis